MRLCKKVLLFSLLLALAIPAGATTIGSVDLGTLADRAELIFVGTVISTESVPTKDGNYAFTYVTFDIDQALKGISRSGKTITLRFAGGQSGSDVYEVEGAPTFTVGGKHLLFARANEKSLVPLVGWFQGKLDIVPHPVTQQPMLVDYAGQAVDGVADGRHWRRGGLKLHKDGSLKQPRDRGVSVVSQEGVRIELEQPEKLVDRAEPVGKVLGELRAFIKSRKGTSPKYKESQFFDSASKANVPDTFSLTAVRAPSVTD
jgi:hypothetical protein